jgi:TIR domain
MPIAIDTLRQAASRFTAVKARTMAEARAQGLQTVFLCHSHQDDLLVKGVITLLAEAGWRVYVDWADASMPETPTPETAARIKQKIVDMNYFLFLATANSTSSRWCPWEIGYADGKKQIDRILILPTLEGAKVPEALP